MVWRSTRSKRIRRHRWHLSGARRQQLRAETRNEGQAMEIEGTTFGTITIDGKTYEHDVIIRLSG
ncbi:MAG TPA: hypothetical protein VEN78_28705, partial [Bradyrhizobium sp.]|nr:hypothetical protein [Bradyrhizobium sp.]